LSCINFFRYYDLEKWEAKRQKKNELKALKKAGKEMFSIADDEKRHELLHRRVDKNKYGIICVKLSNFIVIESAWLTYLTAHKCITF
jgi:hypothetical protein